MIAPAVRFALLMLAVVSLAGAAPAGGERQLPVNQQRAIEAAARKELRAFGAREPIPGAFIAIYVPGYAPYVKSVGYANVQAKAPFRLSDKFRVGSNTKTFIVTVLLQLADEGRLRLDDPISKFNIGVKVPNGNNITVRQLCEMRSGLFEAYDTPQFPLEHHAANAYCAAATRALGRRTETAVRTRRQVELQQYELRHSRFDYRIAYA